MKNTPPKPKAGKPATPAKTRPLTVQQERFCEFIAAGENQTEAWLKAGYKVSRSVARRNAAESLTKPDIKARIAELRKPQTRKAVLTKDRKREMLLEIAESSREKTQDRLRALEIDAKLAGHFEPDRVEVDVGEKTLMTIKERAEQMVSAMARKA